MSDSLATKRPSINAIALEAGAIATGAEAIAASQTVWNHARTEFESDLGAIMATVDLDGPRVYALPTAETGPPMVADSVDAIVEHYSTLYSSEQIVDWQTRFELRSPWYTFFDGEVIRHPLGDPRPDAFHEQTIVLFPMGGGDKILGEMPWPRFPQLGIGHSQKRERLPQAVCDRKLSRELFNRYLDAFRANDADGATAAFAEGAGVSARDYHQKGSGLIDATAADFHRGFLAAYEVTTVDFVHLLAEDWYVFAELQWNAIDRETRKACRFNTVDFFPLVEAGFAARVGYGTGIV